MNINISGEVVRTSQLPKRIIGLGDYLIALNSSPLETSTVLVSDFVSFLNTQFATSLASLTDVSINGPLVGQALVYNGSRWVNQGIGELDTLNSVTTRGNSTTNNITVGTLYFGNASHYLVTDNASYAMLSSNRTLQLATSGNPVLSVFTSQNVGIGTTTDSGFKLDVNGNTRVKGSGSTSATNAFTVLNSLGNSMLTVGNAGAITATEGDITTNTVVALGLQARINQSLFIRAPWADSTNVTIEVIANKAQVLIVRPNANLTLSSGTHDTQRITHTFAPTSGTGVVNALTLNQTINQTGGANGITRGLYINPTITAAADFRAIQTTAGKIIHQGLTNATHASQVYYNTSTGELTYGAAPVPTTPTLDQVTAAGNTTLSDITVGGINSTWDYSLSRDSGSANSRLGRFKFIRSTYNPTGVSASIDFWRGGSAYEGILAFSTNPGSSIGDTSVERMRITDSGNVLIGTTTDAGYRLDVSGTGRFTSTLTIATSATGSSPSNSILISTSDNGNGGRISFGDSNTSILRFSNSLYFREYTGNFVFEYGGSGGVLFSVRPAGTTVSIGNFVTTGSITAASALGRGVHFNNTLVAAANNDVLVGLDINPTFTNGAFTGVTNLAARIRGNTEISRTGADTQLTVARGGGAGFTIQGKANSTSFSEGVNLYWTNNTWLHFIQGSSVVANFSNVGNLLVGTSTDSGYKLDVSGTARVIGLGTFAGSIRVVGQGIFGQNNLDNSGVVGIDQSGTGGAARIYMCNSGGSAYPIWFDAGGNSYFNSGNLGIGTTSPSQKLDVQGNISVGVSSATTVYTYYNSTTRNQIVYTNNSSFEFHEGVNERVRIVGGNVLIGTTTDAGYKLDVNGAARVNDIFYVTNSAYTGNLRIEAFGNSKQRIIGAHGENITWGAGGNTMNLNAGEVYVSSSFLGPNFWIQSNGAFCLGQQAGADASSILDIRSTTKGFLKPRLTTIQKNAITTPATGLEVYDSTTNTPNYYNGTTWVGVASNQSTGLSPGLFAQTSDSTPVTNTTVETTLISTGVGTLSVPANQFQVGASYIAYLSGVISSQNNATLEIHLRSNGFILADTSLMTLSAATGKFWELHINFTIRAIGGGGVAAIVTSGRFSYNKNAGNNPESVGFSSTNNTTFDTTINNTLVINARWGSASPLDSIYTKIFNLYRVY
jgi:hypothetical protein